MRCSRVRARRPGTKRRDPVLDELRQRIHHHLIDELGPILYDKRLSEDDLRRRVHEQLHAALAQERAPLSAADKAQLIQDVSDDILGYGPIDRLLKDEEVTEVMVNGPESVYVERAGRIERTNASFVDETHLRRIIDKIVSQVGRRIDEATPMVDARLPDGSRVNAVIHPLAIGGPFLTIRKFSKDPYQIDDLIRFGTLNAHAARFLQACVVGRLNVHRLRRYRHRQDDHAQRAVVVHPDRRAHRHHRGRQGAPAQPGARAARWRPARRTSRARATSPSATSSATRLRMRPDRVVVGECRGGEALDMLQAMNTGHDGSITTIHSNSPRDTLARIETMTLMAGFDLPVRAIREQMASALDLIVHLTRLRDGTRRITHVTEVQGMEGDVITLQDIFLFDFGMGIDEHGRFKGHLKATGVRPKFAEKLADLGIRLGPEVFQPEAFARRAQGAG